jgi:class 3 adenylate cyclase
MLKSERHRQEGKVTARRVDTWDDLVDGHLGEFAFLRVDIVDHSRITAENAYQAVEHILEEFENLVEDKVIKHDGQLWSWGGDGGVASFYQGANITVKALSAVTTAFEILDELVPFNEQHRLPRPQDKIAVRIAVHLGTARFREKVGRIHSESINFVSHLEHSKTFPNSISVSHEALIQVWSDFGERFVPAGTFENHRIYTSDREKGIAATTPVDAKILKGGLSLANRLRDKLGS